MDADKKLLEINDYYHEELEKALSIMYNLQSPYIKTDIPESIRKDITDFTERFGFRYIDDETGEVIATIGH